MRILMVGVLDVPSSTNVQMALAFEDNGHEVDAYNYRLVLDKFKGNTTKLADHFVEYISQGTNYDLIIFCKTDTLHQDAIAYATSLYTTWYWFMDPLFTAKTINAIDKAANTTYASATSTEVAEYFNTKRESTLVVPEGFSESLFFKTNTKKIRDLIFIGNYSQKREDILFELSKHFKLNVFGLGWNRIKAEQPVFLSDYRKVVNESKIALNILQGQIVSDRVVNTLGCGTFCLTEFSDILKKQYKKDWLDTFKTTEEAIEKIKYYLENEEERERIANIGHSGVKMYYTWSAVCYYISEVVKENSIAEGGAL